MHADRNTLNWSVLAAMLLAGCQPEAATSPAVSEAGSNKAALTSTITPLGALPNVKCRRLGSVAVDVNASGMIVGDALCDATTLPVWWDQALTAHLFPVGIASQLAHTYAVNANGVAIGTNGLQGLWWPNPNSFRTLPTLAGQWSTPRDINDAGDIVGYADFKGDVHAFYYSTTQGQISDLGTLPGYPNSRATAIAPDGTIAGFCYDGLGFGRAVWWDALHSIHDLGTLVSYSENQATDINANHDIVGTSYPFSGPRLAWRLTHGTTSYIPLPPQVAGGQSVAFHMNNVGAIVGQASFQSGDFAALVFPNSTGWKNLGTLPGYDRSAAFAVDQTCGRIVGQAYNFGYSPGQAVLWTGWKC